MFSAIAIVAGSCSSGNEVAQEEYSDTEGIEVAGGDDDMYSEDDAAFADDSAGDDYIQDSDMAIDDYRSEEEPSTEAIADGEKGEYSEFAESDEGEYSDEVVQDDLAQPEHEDESEYEVAEADAVEQVEQVDDPGLTVDRERAPYRGVARPQLASQPFASGAYTMNAIYFVRSNRESWQSVSQLLYGRNDRAALISKWNGGARLKPGKAIYYNSPSRPEDQSRMQFFAEDFGANFEAYTVQKGESLSLIAKRVYGSSSSWKELSAINPELDSPDRVKVGQAIRLQPRSIDTAAVLQQIVAMAQSAQSEQSEQSTQVAKNEEPNKASARSEDFEQAEQSATAAVEDFPPPPPPLEPEAQLSSTQSFASKLKSIPRHWLLLGIASILLGLGGAVLIKQKIEEKRRSEMSSMAGPYDPDSVTRVSNDG